MKPFLSDKGSYGNENYSLSENGQITKDEGETSEIFNDKNRPTTDQLVF